MISGGSQAHDLICQNIMIMGGYDLFCTGYCFMFQRISD